jgi:hypothetical protein
MVATDLDERSGGEACLVAFIEQRTDGGIPGGNLAEMIGQILSHLRHVGPIR